MKQRKERSKSYSQGILENDRVNVGCLSLGHGRKGRDAHGQSQGGGGGS